MLTLRHGGSIQGYGSASQIPYLDHERDPDPKACYGNGIVQIYP
jgi:hypothetical protein